MKQKRNVILAVASIIALLCMFAYHPEPTRAVVADTMTLPSSPPTYPAGTSGVPLYMSRDGRLFVAMTAPGVMTDDSGTITAGGTAQVAAAANTSRVYLFVQNNSTGDEWVNFTTTAVQSQPSIKMVPGASLTYEGGSCSSEAVSIIGATTGQTYTMKEITRQ